MEKIERQVNTAKLDCTRLYHGVAYYPELWPSDEVDRDIAIFKELGINAVRMGEFAWSFFEPKMDEFNIGVYDDVIKKLGDNGIMSILCTPTATPPQWFAQNYPDGFYVDKNMVKAHHGSREHVCLNNKDYVVRTKIIVEKLAEHYGRNPYVIAWQTHNEFNCPPVKECVCDSCRDKWRAWLKKKYGSVEKMNEAWGAGVWSTRYGSFDGVLPPRPTPNGHSASLTTNYSRFVFDSVADYNNMQISILKKHTGAPVTHNTNRVFWLDQETLFKNLDFVGFDDYSTQDNYEEKVFAAEMSRGLKPGVPFWEIETASSNSANLHGSVRTHKKGYLKAEAVSDFFAGAIGFSYWLYRQQRAGTEMPHAHLVTAWGTKSYSCQSVLQVKAAIDKIEKFITSTTPKRADAAVMYSDTARAYCESETLNSVNYTGDIFAFYKSLLYTGAYRDVVYEGNDLSPYKVVFAPYIMHISAALKDKLITAAKNGATVIIGPYSGWRTNDHTYHTDRAFGDLEEFFGGEIIDVAQFWGQDASFEVFGVRGTVETVGAVVKSGVGKIIGGFFDGMSLMSERALGSGKIVFLGARLNEESMNAIIKHYVAEKVGAGVSAERGIVKYIRTDGEGEYVCLVNMSDAPKDFETDGVYTDYFDGKTVNGKHVLDSCDYTVLKRTDQQKSTGSED
ncbi:MAG: beta-galactosidase [Clostridiales bacterium]|nr:beta-galactosidase [Clostridiales bacterium]